MLRREMRLCLLAIWALAALTGGPAAAQSWTQAGVLTCRLNPSIGFIIVGHQSMECKFQPVGSNPAQL